MEENVEMLDLLKDNNTLKNFTSQQSSSGHNSAKNRVYNTFIPLTINESNTVPSLINSYFSLLETLISSGSMYNHKDLILEKLDRIENLIFDLVEDEKQYREKLLVLLEKINKRG